MSLSDKGTPPISEGSSLTTNYLPRVLPPYIITLEIRFQYMNFERKADIQSIAVTLIETKLSKAESLTSRNLQIKMR